jgi:hypothetical protein
MAAADPTLDRARALIASDDEPTRLSAVHLLRDCATDRDAAARLLVATLCDPGSYVPHAARAALSDLGAAAHAALFDAVRGGDAHVRTQALWALAVDAGPVAPQVAAVVAERVDDAETTVRHAAAGALGRVGCGGAVVEAALRRLAADREPRVRAEALASLGLAFTDPAAVRDVLLDALDDGAAPVRAAAAASLARVRPVDDARERVRAALAEECHDATALELRTLLERWETGR